MREMKDSGIEWIGTIPASWKTIKNKYIFRLRSGEAISKEDLIDDGLYPVYGGGERIGYYNNFNVSSNSFLIGRVGARCGCVTPVNSLCWATDNALIAELIDMNYYYTYALIAADLNRLNESNAQPLITATKVLNVSIPKPDKKEQLLIAEFLSNMSNECDTLIIDIQSQIEALEEYKRSVITEAVTKGLDPDVEMKDSGVQWIGDMPSHWSLFRIASLYAERNERGNDELPLLSVSINTGVSDSELSDEESTRVFVRSEDRSKYKRVYPQDLTYNMMRAWQGAFGAVRVNGMVSPAYVVAKPLKKIDTRYIEALLRTPSAIQEMHRYSYGVADFRLRLYWDKFRTIKVCFPPLEEQHKIADYIDEKANEIDAIIATKQRQIETIEEYKKSLIFEYVTGKKEVVNE